MEDGPTIVHVTHETVHKIGGIGEVLNGFFTSQSYIDYEGRTIVTGPIFDLNVPVSKRMGDNGTVLYSSFDGVANTKYASAFEELERIYHTHIVYGTKTFIDEQTKIESTPEIVLIDVSRMHEGPVNDFKRILFEKYGIESNRYEHIWEYEQYIRLAPVVLSILKAIDAANDDTTIVAHEFMGMPAALAGLADPYYDFKTVFYAHEVAPVRRIVEEIPGCDAQFYNAMFTGRVDGTCLADTFGDQSDYFKEPLVKASRHCHAICAVGDYAAEELMYLAPGFNNTEIDVVYNGIPSYKTELTDKLDSKRKLQKYCNNLLNFEPDYIFTHVTRLVRSKGLWRDIEILAELDKKFVEADKTGVYFLLSTEVAQRDPDYIRAMERGYGWPVAHKEGWPDMSGGETNFNTLVQRFNAQSRNIKAVFINQFGFNRSLCGDRMPEDMCITDIRRGTDVEFGLSIYEPFGISHLEPLTYGGICIVTNTCGCAGFVDKTAPPQGNNNVVIADYTDFKLLPEDLKLIDSYALREIEQKLALTLSEKIWSKLPADEAQVTELIEHGYEMAKQMSWQTVLDRFVIPAFKEAVGSKKLVGAFNG